MRSVVITGASSGIGRAIALRLAKKNWKVFAGIRGDDDIGGFDDQHSAIVPIRLDVTDNAQIRDAVARVDQYLDGVTLTGLVNNAGIARLGPIALQPMDEIKLHFEVNVFGAISMSQGFAPLLGQDTSRRGKPGRIINITSVGGEVASPFLGAYTATKHAMESVTDTLRRELHMFGIDAIAVGPGATKTPIWDKAQATQSTAYEVTPWSAALEKFLQVMTKAGHTGLSVERVAEIVEKALIDSRPHARYAPVPKKLTNYYLLRLLPKRLVDQVFYSRFGLSSPSESR